MEKILRDEETSRYIKCLTDNASQRRLTFQEFMTPYVQPRNRLAKYYDVANLPQTVIIAVSRWPDTGICINLTYLDKNNNHVLQLVWNPPHHDIFKVTMKTKPAPPASDPQLPRAAAPSRIYYCDRPASGYIYDRGDLAVIDWMKMKMPLTKSYRVLITYRSHTTTDEEVLKSNQPFVAADNTVVANLIELNQPTEISARNWFARPDRGVESIFLDCSNLVLPTILNSIKFNVSSRVFSIDTNPTTTNARLGDQIAVISRERFESYFLTAPMTYVPKIHRDTRHVYNVSTKIRKSSGTAPSSVYVSRNDTARSIGKAFKIRGYIYFNDDPFTDGVFVATGEKERVLYFAA